LAKRLLTYQQQSLAEDSSAGLTTKNDSLTPCQCDRISILKVAAERSQEFAQASMLGVFLVSETRRFVIANIDKQFVFSLEFQLLALKTIHRLTLVVAAQTGLSIASSS
jgi:hypothetical protein